MQGRASRAMNFRHAESKIMNSIAEKVFEAVKTLSDRQATEVLDFVDFLKSKPTSRGLETAPSQTGEIVADPKEHAAWVGRMRAITAAQPMTHATVEDLRREARY
jgi:hypothetical protein